jgi:spore germination protein KA
VFLPSAYVAFTTFHQEVIPRSLALAIAVQREMVPYPAIVEALALTLVFEIVTEASIRLPRPMGLTIGIVGTLVIGESAVRANLASNVMIIVVAATALAQFTIMHPMTVTVRLLRLPILILSSAFGLYGIFFAVIVTLLHLSSLRTFGEPYLAPYAPAMPRDITDTAVRLPIWAQVTRPTLEAVNLTRQPPGQQPAPPDRKSDVLELETRRTVPSENPPVVQDEVVQRTDDDGLPRPASRRRRNYWRAR